MKIYVSHSTTFSDNEAQGLLDRAANVTPTSQWTKRQLGCGKHVERQGTVIWDHTHCWILRPEEARAWGDQPPTHTGSRYQAYRLHESNTLRFAAHLTWSPYIPEKVSITLHAQAAKYWANILFQRARSKVYREQKAVAKAKRLAMNAKRRAAYAAKKLALTNK